MSAAEALLVAAVSAAAAAAATLFAVRVLLTNGPFIELLVNGQPPGSFITDTDGRLDILLRVRAANFVDTA